ncbi:ribbon-helix-helix domain-containing protein [Geomonas sp. RF6]|uniref:ribbon-helix-helix protein, CopG family n=1 Tax=Geomonas sp. RF6 TaxID=2897342 RepID=UPI001E33B5A7|nr:ribbon-helix-helix protein, CopG family [Geomonas sp. RF6]UFS68994.1 ribbon-helix-helix domain-containing protein [Geomonas sp. RF6]
MQYHQKISRTTATRRKKKAAEDHLNSIVSLRITDQEKEFLDRVSRATSRNVSDVVREAISFWVSTRQTLCLKP